MDWVMIIEIKIRHRHSAQHPHNTNHGGPVQEVIHTHG
jgi:hypothetical protein